MVHAVAAGHDDPLTIACRDADFQDWHRGRAHAVAWVLDLDRPDVRRLVGRARIRLDDYLLARYQRQPHVTVSFGGLLPGREALPDDYTERDLARDLDVLRGLADGPVTLRAAGWGTFPMVPYLALECGWARTANSALTVDAPETHTMEYHPHVTVGHYRGSWPLREPLGHLSGLAHRGDWVVGEVRLVAFRTADIAGPLQTLGRLDLTTREWLPAQG